MPNVKLIVYRRYEYATMSLTTQQWVQNNESRLLNIHLVFLPSFEKNTSLTQPFKVFIKCPSVGAKHSDSTAVFHLKDFLKDCLSFLDVYLFI